MVVDIPINCCVRLLHLVHILVLFSKYMKTTYFLRNDFRCLINIAGITFFLDYGLPFFTVATIMSPEPATGNRFKRPFTSLKCVIPVVLSNNKNKLMVYIYIVTNTTIFLIVRLILLRYNYMFRPSMLAIFRLYMKHLTISYIYM